MVKIIVSLKSKLRGYYNLKNILNTGLLCQVINSVTFSGKPVGSEEFLNQMFEALGIIIDRCLEGRSSKNGELNHRKNRMCFYLKDRFIK
jgi:hypothetical protein